MAQTILLGMDWLRQFSVKVDFTGEGSVTIKESEIPLKKNKLRIIETTIIPPMTVEWIECESNTEDDEYIFEPSEYKIYRSQIFAPKCLVTISDKKTYIPISNTTNSIKLYI